MYAAKLKKLGISTVGDLLYHLPFRYEDYSIIAKISSLQAGEKVTVTGAVKSIENVYTKQRKKIQKAQLIDETGEIEIIWYNQPFLTNILKSGTRISISGTTMWFGNHLVFESPEYEIIKQTVNFIHTGRLVPIYPETAGITSKWMRSRISSILFKFSPTIIEFLPNSTLTKFKLMNERSSIYSIHFPKTLSQASEARRRLAFDELLSLILAADIRRRMWQKEAVSQRFQIRKIKPQILQFINQLPFKLTNAQNKAVSEILQDLGMNKSMNRLLEGDVGSGKTVVATIAIFASCLSGYQSTLMAPTEILATQHFNTISGLLSPYGIKVILLTGATKVKKELLKKSNFDVFIGTHALLSEHVSFKKLGLVVIDEQQRFGVEQRAQLREKGKSPHILTMTATPIPRSIALTIYSDLDLSIIDEMPKGRVRVKTWVVPPVKRDAAYSWIRKQIISTPPRKQAFIICPLIDESESLATVKAVKVEYLGLKEEIFPDLHLGLLHGKLKGGAKNKVLEEFRQGKLDILVATPVVEVGIDIPNATIMMIEGADRFGLSQLHQLRGRVGRRNLESFCLLFSETNNPKTLDRLKLLERTYIGPKLAELDLTLRGPGQLYGTKQHGDPGLKIANFSDIALIEEAKQAADNILSVDPSLSTYPILKDRLQKYTIEKIAPD
jgi:ATP-dependent DNA helicase RecG